MRHRTLRRQFAAKFLCWPKEKWRNIIFSDEKIFKVRPGGKVKYWKQINQSKFAAKYVIPQVQKAEGVMIWAAMNGKGNIVVKRCPPKVKSQDYQDILGQAATFIRPRQPSTHPETHFTPI